MLLEVLRSHAEKSENMYTLKRKTSAYIKFRKFYTKNIADIENTCYNPAHDLINGNTI